MDIVLPKDVKLPWYLVPMMEREPHQRMWHAPWNGPIIRYPSMQITCPFDGAMMWADVYADYSFGYPPEPAYGAFCPFCLTEYDL